MDTDGDSKERFLEVDAFESSETSSDSEWEDDRLRAKTRKVKKAKSSVEPTAVSI